MEEQRSFCGGLFDVANTSGRATPISITATFAVGALLLVILISATRGTSATGASPLATNGEQTGAGVSAGFLAQTSGGAPAPSDLSGFAPQVVGVLASQYAAMQQNGTYTAESAADFATKIAPSIKAPLSYKTYSIVDITTTPDVSPERIQRYQQELRTALAPLSNNTTPEISLVSAYAQTNDPKYLTELRAVVDDYKKAIAQAAVVTTPRDALQVQIGILNAMGQFSASLTAYADYASDPITVMGVLNTYNDAEQNMITSFNALADYMKIHATP